MKKEKNHQLPRKSYDADVVGKIIVAFFAGVVGTVLVMSIYLDHQNRPIAATSPPSVSSHTHDTVSVPVYGEQVNRIAAWFDCPCADKCGDTLDVCICNAPRGAREIKNFIQTQLDAGKKENDVVKLVQQKYGGLKPTMKEKFKAL